MMRSQGKKQMSDGGWPVTRDAGECAPVSCHLSLDTRHPETAFTLMEVMIAAAIFFMCSFTILALLASTLRSVRALQHATLDAGMLAAELSLTNRLYEGTESGDFGDLYPDYQWTREIYEVSSNRLFEVDFTIFKRTGDRPTESHMSVLLYRPDSPPGSMDGLGR
jgi:hypothetical protein